MVITIIENRQSQYVIAVPKNATMVKNYGAQELQEYLLKATGVQLPIITEDAVTSKAFYVGQTAYARTAGICGAEKENWKMKMNEPIAIRKLSPEEVQEILLKRKQENIQ